MPSNSSPAYLHARGVSVQLGSQQILDRLDLPDLPTQSLVALMGPNGSGKSTLLKAIAGLVPAQAQVLRLGELELGSLDGTERAASIRYLPQSIPADVHLTVGEAILVALNARRPMEKSMAHRKAHAILSTLGIAALVRSYLDELSGGQKQLVGLAQALVHDPRALLLDEPLAALDLNHQHHVMQVLARLTAGRKLLTVIVLHDLDMALRYADTALLMNHGGLVASGPPLEVITPKTLAQVFSIEGRVETCSRGHAHVCVDDLILT